MKNLVALTLILFCTGNLFSQINNVHYFKKYTENWYEDISEIDTTIGSKLTKTIGKIVDYSIDEFVGISIVGNQSGNFIQINTNSGVHVISNIQNGRKEFAVSRISDKEIINRAGSYYFGIQPQSYSSPMKMVGELKTPCSINADINGDGLEDILIFEAHGFDSRPTDYRVNQNPNYWDTWKNKFDIKVKVFINTGFGFFSEDELSDAVTAFRLGYISGYYGGFAQASSINNNSSNTKGQHKNTSFKMLSIDSSTEQITINKRINNYVDFKKEYEKKKKIKPEKEIKKNLSQITSSYDRFNDISFFRKILSDKYSMLILSGFEIGINDGKNVKRNIDKILEGDLNYEIDKRTLKDDSKKSIISKDIGKKIIAIKAINKLPLYDIAIKNIRTGELKMLSDFSSAEQESLNLIIAETNSRNKFVEKMTNKDVFDTSPSFIKIIENDYAIYNPAILLGQTISLFTIYSSVIQNNVIRTLEKVEDNSKFWVDLERNIVNFYTSIPDENLESLSKSINGIHSIEFLDGYRNGKLYLENAQAVIHQKVGEVRAARAMVSSLQRNFPDFKNSKEILSVDDAIIVINNYVGDLHSLINRSCLKFT